MVMVKRLLLFLLVGLLLPLLSSAQPSEFWSVSAIGGDFDLGYIYKTDNNGNNLEVIHHFEGSDGGGSPNWNLTEASNGRLYGVTTSGGANGVGVLFSISPADNRFEVHHDFVTDLPLGSMVLASNGKLYGFQSGGWGLIFEFDPETEVFDEIHEFTKTNGGISFGNNLMVEVSENVLYGVTRRGGSEDFGVIFKYEINTNNYDVVFEFDNSAEYGRNPTSIHFTDGLLYGMTSWQDRKIFEFDMVAEELTTVFQIPSINGLNPGILLASDGNYYGTTGTDGTDGHGSFFRVDPVAEEFTTIHSFLEFTGPHIPDVGVIEARNGKLYGTTRYVSRANAGVTLFEYDLENEAFDIKSQLSGGLALSIVTEVELECNDYDEIRHVDACDEFEFNGLLLTTSGVYEALFESSIGCDSLVNLNLTIQSEEVSIMKTTCDSFQFGDDLLDASGDYEKLFTNQAGCDSLVNLTLEIMAVPSPNVEVNDQGMLVTEQDGDSYQWYHCNTNEPITRADQQQWTPPQSGEYFVEVTAGECSAQSDCISFAVVTSVDDQLDRQIPVYPNPSFGWVNIDLTNDLTRFATIEVADLTGRIYQVRFEQQQDRIVVEMPEVAGVYLITIRSEGELPYTTRIIKE